MSRISRRFPTPVYYTHRHHAVRSYFFLLHEYRLQPLTLVGKRHCVHARARAHIYTYMLCIYAVIGGTKRGCADKEIYIGIPHLFFSTGRSIDTRFFEYSKKKKNPRVYCTSKIRYSSNTDTYTYELDYKPASGPRLYECTVRHVSHPQYDLFRFFSSCYIVTRGLYTAVHSENVFSQWCLAPVRGIVYCNLNIIQIINEGHSFPHTLPIYVFIMCYNFTVPTLTIRPTRIEKKTITDRIRPPEVSRTSPLYFNKLTY